MSQGKIVQCIGAVVDVEFPRDAMPKVYDACSGRSWHDMRSRPDLRSAAAAGRRRRAYHRPGFLRRPAPRHEGQRTPARRSRCRSAKAPWAASWTCWAARSTKLGPIAGDERALDPPQGPEVRRTVSFGRTAGNRHQGDRPGLPVRQGRQGRPVRRCRRGQDREHDGTDQQHRQGALAACRCSPAWASVPAKATTSTTK